MTTLEQRARDLVEWFTADADVDEDDLIFVEKTLREVRRDALEEAAKIADGAYSRMFPKPRYRITAEIAGNVTARSIRDLTKD